MLKIVNPIDAFAASRLVELISPNPPWYRSLWSVGIALMLGELSEAASAQRSGILGENSIKRLVTSVLRVAGQDPALTDYEKSFLREQARQTPRANSVAWESLAQLRRQIDSDYLERWIRVSRSPDLSAERFARCVASHILDLGFSSEFVHGLTKQRLYVDNSDITLTELCEELATLSRRQTVANFEVLVAFGPSRIPLVRYPSDWLRAAGISLWLRQNRFSTAHIRPTIGVLLSVSARDAFGAAKIAIAAIDRVAARAAIGTGRRLSPLPYLWVKGYPDRLPLAESARGVRVEALSREQLIFAASTNSGVDAAIELLAHLENSSPPVAVAGGWGAIEGLLGEPGDRAAAADNLAALVACSVPRAELTAMSYVLAKGSNALKLDLDAAATNRDRAELVARWIIEQRPLNLTHTSDNAAVNRLRKVLARPAPTLQDIQVAAADAFHRLYRQRNLILHGGITNSVVLAGSLRTVSKLAGAGIDRVVHGVYVQKMRPLELVARAKLSLAAITPATAIRCVDLLGG
jgi:hypothetical protein